MVKRVVFFLLLLCVSAHGQNGVFVPSANIEITQPTQVFLPPSVKSVQAIPATYRAEALSKEIENHYSGSLVMYGVFYALFFFLTK